MKEILGIVVFCAMALAAVWYGPGWWRSHRESQVTTPSIMALQNTSLSPVTKGESSEASTNTPLTTTPTAPSASLKTTQTVEKAKVQVKVLNGGAVPGSAGKIVKALQSAGFTLAKGGDAKGDYSGVSVFYLEGNQAEANEVKAALGRDLALVKFEVAKDPKQETGSTSVVVVLGK
jgi:hypothetical protein